MRNTKIRFKYCTEENVDFIVRLPKEINMTDIIEVLGNDEATIENIEEVIEILGGIIIDTEIGDTNELFSLEEVQNISTVLDGCVYRRIAIAASMFSNQPRSLCSNCFLVQIKNDILYADAVACLTVN